MKAYSLIRPGPEYRSEAFLAGLAAVGYDVVNGTASPPAIGRADVLVIWNRYGPFHEIARRFEAAGAAVIVAENGYMGADRAGNQFYALSIGAHNGAGRTVQPDAARWKALGIELKPLRDRGEHILIRAQRGIGLAGLASPPNWHLEAAAHLRTITSRPIKILEHPRTRKMAGAPRVRLKDIFANCHAVVTWASAIAGRALVAGVPVFLAGPHSIVEAACGRDWRSRAGIEEPHFSYGARAAALARLAANQWSLAEIAAGGPFRRLAALHAEARAA